MQEGQARKVGMSLAGVEKSGMGDEISFQSSKLVQTAKGDILQNIIR